MPAGHIAVLDQKHAAGAIDHHRAHAEREPAREPPIDMKQPAQKRFEWLAERLQGHRECAVAGSHFPIALLGSFRVVKANTAERGSYPFRGHCRTSAAASIV